jgi:outer membrane protein insertion porin family
VQLGTKSSEAILSFEEPWLFQQQLALGYSIFRTSSDYNSSNYQEIRTGGEIYLRKRLFELVEGRLSYGGQAVDIRNVTPGYKVVYPEKISVVTNVSFQLLRDTRDKLINTTKGNRIEFNTELASSSLGGDVDYYKFETRAAQYFPLFETQNQVLAILGRVGVLDPYGNTSQVPFYDRFYLGGPYTLRGFAYREVGPKAIIGTDHPPMGGDTYGMYSLEYSFDIVEPVRFAVFYDSGFVNKGSYDFSPASYNDDFGFGLRLTIAGAPLSLDYGIPLTGDNYNKKSGQFNFSFGTRF